MGERKKVVTASVFNSTYNHIIPGELLGNTCLTLSLEDIKG